MPEITPASRQNSDSKKPFMVFAFSGGGLDTVMQIGTIHALMLTGEEPDVVLGVSAGAINAVALGEVLTASNGREAKDRDSARAGRFLQILEAYRETPAELFRGFWPDHSEVRSKEPVPLLESPVQFAAERVLRQRSVDGRAGLVTLMNGLLSTRIRFSRVTRIVRLLLDFAAAGDIRNPWARARVKIKTGLRILIKLWWPSTFFAVSFSLGQMVWAVLHGQQRAKRVPEMAVQTNRTAKDLLFRWRLRDGFRRVGGWLLGASILLFFPWLVLVVMGFAAVLLNQMNHVLLVIVSSVLVTMTLALMGTAALGAAVVGVAAFGALVVGTVAVWLNRIHHPLLILLFSALVAVNLVLSGTATLGSAALGAAVVGTVGVWVHQNNRLWLDILFYVLVLMTSVWSVFILWLKVRLFPKKGPPSEHEPSPFDHFLEYFTLKSELGDSFGLRQAFVRIFDPGYYGKFDMDYAVGTSLFDTMAERNRPQVPRGPSAVKTNSVAHDGEQAQQAPKSEIAEPKPKTLEQYRQPSLGKVGETTHCSIHIVPVAANIRTLEMKGLPPKTSVVDALMAATAIAPFFRAQSVPVSKDGNDTPETEWYIDGVNVANEPIREALLYLRENRPDCVSRSKIQLFSVSPFPVPKPESPVQASDGYGNSAYTELIPIANRGLELQRFRDAEMEQNLVRLYNEVLPEGQNEVRLPGVNGHPETSVLRATPIEIESHFPLRLNVQVPVALPDERRKLVDEAIAVGCYQTLRKLVEIHIDDREPDQKWGPREGDLTCQDFFKKRGVERFPGSSSNVGPGISEICKACRNRNGEKDGRVFLREPKKLEPTSPPEKVSSSGNPPATVPVAAPVALTTAPPVGPFAACLFSGGVFRGVFQIGVANALQMLGVKPKVVAGASVGSITGALIAQVLSPAEQGQRTEDERTAERVKQMRMLAATYLGLDRLVLTDRIADFIRKLTLRAGYAEFSLRDIDIVFRRLEENSSGAYFRRLRRVVAGLERITYSTLYELVALAKAIRESRPDQIGKTLGKIFQKMLERYGVGAEVLGAEPLALLLRELVLRKRPHPDQPSQAPVGTEPKTLADDPEAADFKIFGDMDLIAVTTNLKTGCLAVLKSNMKGPSASSAADPEGDSNDPRLLDGLLASSAFPGAFRPRWSWEIFRKPGREATQYCDGGVLDNLPFNAVIDHLVEIRGGGQAGGVKPPAGGPPDLIFTASLEPLPVDWKPEETEEAAKSWRKILNRAQVMKNNKKIDDFVRVQREIQQIVEMRPDTARLDGAKPFRPIPIHVIAVKPKWLCGTFAFHPMLGFRRENQAASIAHGCYQTFKAFHDYQTTGADNYFRDDHASADDQEAQREKRTAEANRNLQQWIGAHAPAQGAKAVNVIRNFVEIDSYAGISKSGSSVDDDPKYGLCWHFVGEVAVRCPFARAKDGSTADAPLEPRGSAADNIAKNLERIYLLCGERATHERAPAS